MKEFSSNTSLNGVRYYDINVFEIFFVIQIFQLIFNLMIPTNFMVFLFLVTEVFGLYILKKRFLNLLSIATISYNIFFTIPYLITFFKPLEDIATYASFLMVPEYFDKSIFYFITFKTTFNIAFLLSARGSLTKPDSEEKFLTLKIKYIPKIAIYIVAILVFGLEIFLGIGFNNFLISVKEGSRFLLQNATILNLSHSVLFLTFSYGYVLYRNKRLKNYDILFLFIICEIYPFVNSSRAIALPFFVMAFIDWLYEKKYQAFTKIGFSLFFYFFALSFRGRGSGEFQLVDLVDFVKSLDSIFSSILFTTSNLPTLSKTLEGIYSGVINVSFSFFDYLYYILYISPLPAFLLGEKIQKLASLTPHFDFPLGITLDIISESLVWFGAIGPLLFGLFWGFIAGLVNKKFYLYRNLSSILLFVTYIYFIVATNTYPTRHSSRFFIYSLISIVILNFIGKIKYNYKNR